jgi:uncharacterized protein
MAEKRMKTTPIEIIEQVYERGSPAFRILVSHGKLVAQKSVAIAERVAHLNPDVRFLEEAALLHDIGMIFTQSPKLGCHGQHPYVCHGVFGRRLLEDFGLPRHALVCERHVGVGITRDDIRSQQLPLPDRDMLPQSIEEQIICYADKFYSKNGKAAGEEKPVQKILKKLGKYGSEKVQRFQAWEDLFGNR